MASKSPYENQLFGTILDAVPSHWDIHYQMFAMLCGTSKIHTWLADGLSPLCFVHNSIFDKQVQTVIYTPYVVFLLPLNMVKSSLQLIF